MNDNYDDKPRLGRPPKSQSPHDSERPRSIAHTTEALGALGQLGAVNQRSTTENSAKRPPRRPVGTTNVLAVQGSLIPPGVYVRWANSARAGRMLALKDAYYFHICDDNGVNVTRDHKGETQYLMGLESEYREEDTRLKQKRYHDMIDSHSAIGENEYSPFNKKSAVSSSMSDSIDD